MAPWDQWNHDTEAKEVVDTLADRIKGRTFLVTGTTAGGLGANTALMLAHHSPAHLILVSRTQAKTQPLIDDINKLDPKVKVTFVACELSDQDSVRKAAAQINADASVEKIDAVVNNAGVMAVLDYTLDKHGNELTFSACHIGHFLLTNLLMPKIKAAGPGARVVNLTSQGYQISPVRFDDYNFSGGAAYDPWSAYGQAKTANVLFTKELARRGVLSYAVHPGAIPEGTNLGTHMPDGYLGEIGPVSMRNTGKVMKIHPFKTVSQGTSTTLVAALRPDFEAQSGSYLTDCQTEETYEYASDQGNVERLWELSERLVGQKFEV